jgi:hypothetical protein
LPEVVHHILSAPGTLYANALMAPIIDRTLSLVRDGVDLTL